MIASLLRTVWLTVLALAFAAAAFSFLVPVNESELGDRGVPIGIDCDGPDSVLV